MQGKIQVTVICVPATPFYKVIGKFLVENSKILTRSYNFKFIRRQNSFVDGNLRQAGIRQIPCVIVGGQKYYGRGILDKLQSFVNPPEDEDFNYDNFLEQEFENVQHKLKTKTLDQEEPPDFAKDMQKKMSQLNNQRKHYLKTVKQEIASRRGVQLSENEMDDHIAGVIDEQSNEPLDEEIDWGNYVDSFRN